MRFENFYLLKVQAGVLKSCSCAYFYLFNVVLECKYSILRKNFVGQIFVQEGVLAGSKKYLFD